MKISEMFQLQLDEQNKLVTTITKRKAKAKDATKEWKDSTPELGKLYCVLEIRLRQGQATMDKDGKPQTPTFAASMSLGDLIESVTKEKGDPKGLQCKNAFSCFVGVDGKGKVAEEIYDRLPANVIQISGQIAKALGFDLTKSEMDQVADELSTYGKDTIGNLREILRTVVPADPWETKDADDHVEKLDKDGNLGVVIAAIVRRCPVSVAENLLTEIGNLNTVNGKRVFQAAARMGYRFHELKDEKGEWKFPGKTLTEWFDEVKPHVPLLNGKPVEPENGPVDVPIVQKPEDESAMKAREQELVTA